jgi:hypothetical protein
VKNDFIPSSAYKGSIAMSPLYKNMLDAQSKSQSRVVYNTTVYTAVMNGMQGIIGGTLTPQQFIDSLVKAAKLISFRNSCQAGPFERRAPRCSPRRGGAHSYEA